MKQSVSQSTVTTRSIVTTADIVTRAAAVRRAFATMDLVGPLEAVLRHYVVELAAVCGPRRFKSLASARHALWALLYPRYGSYPEIAALFGVDHTTVMNGVRVARERNLIPGSAAPVERVVVFELEET